MTFTTARPPSAAAPAGVPETILAPSVSRSSIRAPVPSSPASPPPSAAVPGPCACAARPATEVRRSGAPARPCQSDGAAEGKTAEPAKPSSSGASAASRVPDEPARERVPRRVGATVPTTAELPASPSRPSATPTLFPGFPFLPRAFRRATRPFRFPPRPSRRPAIAPRPPTRVATRRTSDPPC